MIVEGVHDRLLLLRNSRIACRRITLREPESYGISRAKPLASWSILKSWDIRLARRSGGKKARVAVARKLAVVLLTMWRSQTPFRWTTKLEAAPN
jgi:ABC-type polar amino acid transport system ATPase subunit